MSDPVKEVLKQIQARAGKSSAMLLSEGTSGDIKQVIPTGIEVLDNYVLGIGGLPAGRMVEVFADEGVGKSSLLLQAIAGAQREGGIAVLAETENGLDSARAKVFGCDLDRVILLQPGSIEETMSLFEATLKSLPKGPPHIVGWDSIAATQTQREFEEGLTGKDKVGERAKQLSKACRILCPLAAERQALLFFVNQTRDNIGVMFGNNKTTPGGGAVKFHSSIRIQMFSGKSVKNAKTGEHLGKNVTIMAVKNKLVGPWRKAKVLLNYETGFENRWSTIHHAKEMGKLEARTKTTAAGHKAALEALGWFPAALGDSAPTDESIREFPSLPGDDDYVETDDEPEASDEDAA